MKNLKLFEEWYGEDPEHMANMSIDNLYDLMDYFGNQSEEYRNKIDKMEHEDLEGKLETERDYYNDLYYSLNHTVNILEQFKEKYIQEIKNDAEKYNL